MDNDGCVKCGNYSGGANLCLACEKKVLKRNVRKARRKRIDPLCLEMLEMLGRIHVNAEDPAEMFEEGGKLSLLITRVKARFLI